MKNFKIFTVVIIIAILIAGIVLLALRSNVLEAINSQAGIENIDLKSIKSNINAADVIDVTILKSDKLDKLSNKVTSFDFDVVCPKQSSIVKTDQGDRASSTVKARTCAVGNSLPFKKAKGE